MSEVGLEGVNMDEVFLKEMRSKLKLNVEVRRAEYTGGQCVVCEGNIIELFVNEHISTTGQVIIGSGSKYQLHESSKGFHCDKCGLKYAFVPEN